MKSQAAIGFYGKLPVLGDFVSRHLPYEFIMPWDEWLQRAIVTSREQLGTEWLNYYLTSPIWRFVLSSGLCGKSAWAGIMMPSVDKVGRYFPFTIAVPFEQSAYLPHLFTLGDEWFEQLETVALTGLNGEVNVQTFEQLIQDIPAFLLPKAEAKLGQVSDAFVGLNAYLSRCHSGYSLWTTCDSEEIRLKLLVYGKLPPIHTFSSFLHGNVMNMATHSDAVFVSNNIHSAAESNTTRFLINPNTLLSDRSSNHDTSKHWQSWAVTDTGKRRKRNEDALLNSPEAGLWAVADGMGGHDAGDVASQLIVNTLQTLFPTVALETTIDDVQNCLQKVNAQLRALARQQGNQIIGSTVVVLLAEQHRCAFLWAGDSRLYRLRAGQLQQLTKDHCPDYGGSDNDGWAVKQANEITRAVGADNELELDCEMSDILAGDIFLLCSDGLDKEVSHNEIEQIMQSHAPKDIANVLLELTLQRGARDNVSIVVVAMRAM